MIGAFDEGWVIDEYIFYLMQRSTSSLQNGVIDRLLFYSLFNIGDRILRREHHEIIYKRSLSSRVIPKGLRLKKTACKGDITEDFDSKWKAILKEAEV